MGRKKHLSFSERIDIEDYLNKSYSFKAIGREINRDCTSISKEVKKHITTKKTGCFGKAFNDCKLRFKCNHSYLCENPNCNHNYCRFCSLCISICNEYIKEECSKLKEPPYVCNGCSSRNKCTLEKHLYIAKIAQKEYEDIFSESRTGLSIDETEIKRLDDIISPLIKRGHSINHICSNNLDTIMHSEKTIYNYVDANIFTARNIDMPRKVRYRPRKKLKDRFKVDKSCRIGRKYEDFLEFIENNPDTPIVEMDTVEGVKGGKVLLTLEFKESSFMLAFIRDSNTSQSVIDIIENIFDNVGADKFKELFPVILTDNGSEFSNPKAIEFDSKGNQRTKIFYCDPASPHQKGAVENNHELIRRIVPKGKTFDIYNQNDIDLMMNHINSYGRKKLNNRSPNQLFSLIHGDNIHEKFNSKHIPPNKILLRPKLLRR